MAARLADSFGAGNKFDIVGTMRDTTQIIFVLGDCLMKLHEEANYRVFEPRWGSWIDINDGTNVSIRNGRSGEILGNRGRWIRVIIVELRVFEIITFAK